MATSNSVIELRKSGLYCPAGNFYIDPWNPVDQAVITHAHSDHARSGHRRYLATEASVPILKTRLGEQIVISGLAYGESKRIGDATVSLHPAGHVLGSAQVRIEVAGQVWVVTGDYKREEDSTCETFDPIRCHGLVTESTFGLPVFQWQAENVVAQQINAWWQANQQQGRASILYGYALGKAQRLLSLLDASVGPIYLHGAMDQLTEIYRQQGIKLPIARLVSEMPVNHDWKNAMVLAVPSAHGSSWTRRFGASVTAMASGWMSIRGNRRRRSVDRGFVISDHADWQGLIDTVHECQPEQVWTTHGYSDVLARFLTDQGINARAIKTEFVGETLDPSREQNEGQNEAEMPEDTSVVSSHKQSKPIVSVDSEDCETSESSPRARS